MKKPPTSFFTVGACLCLLTGSLFGQGIVRLKDINLQTPAAGDFAADTIANVNGTLFIATDDSLSGAELWKSNGTLPGTVLVKDIIPGPNGSKPEQLTAVGSGSAARLFFVVTINGVKRLWISDGTAAGTVQVEAAATQPALREPDKLLAIGDTLYFEGQDNTNGRELWRVRLASKTAELVKDIRGGTLNSGVNNFTNIGGILYFTASDGQEGNELWRSVDGTAATTLMVENIGDGPSSSSPSELAPFFAEDQNYVFFSAQDEDGREIWRSNGTETAQFMNIEGAEGSSDPQDFTVVGDKLFFSAKTAIDGREIWMTDGISLKPSAPVKLVRPGNDTTQPEKDARNLIGIQTGDTHQLLFTIDDGNSGIELWKTDGTFNGTGQVINIAAGVADSSPSNFIKTGPSTILFTASNASNVLGLWKCEGSSGNPVATKIMDFPAGPNATATTIRGLLLVPGATPLVYFMLNADEFWKTDGTLAGTVRIKRFFAGDTLAGFTEGSFPANFTPHGVGTAYFTANDGLVGEELWKTGGTENTTTLVKDIFSGTTGSEPRWLTSGGANLFFSAVGSGTNRELWSYNGTGDPVMVHEIHPSGASNPENLFWSPTLELLFFSATNGTDGIELWRSDGTSAGTFMIKNMNTTGDSKPEGFVEYKGRVYFIANATGSGKEVYSTAGVLNDVITFDLSPSLSSNPTELTVLKDPQNVTNYWLYFAAEAANKGKELWRIDEDKDDLPKQPIKNINEASVSSHASPTHLTVVGRNIFFAATNGTGTGKNGVELWKSDGSEAGTVMVKDIAAGTTSSSPAQLVEVAGKLFFVANNTVDGKGNGTELWVSNGTAAGTLMVKDIVPGLGSPNIQDLHSVNGVAVFSADDGVNGRELWVSDGTPVGTFIVRDLTNDSASSFPQHLTGFGNKLIYSAATYGSGQEPRIGTLDPEITVEIVADDPLVSGELVDFGAASLVNYRTVQFTIRNDGLNILKSLTATLSGANATDFSIVTKPPTSLGPDAVFNLSIKFAPKAVGERLARLTITSTDPDESPFIIDLKGTGENVFTQLPLSQMVVVGDSVTFTVGVSTAGDAVPSIQWKKGGNMAGATDEEYKINKVTLSHFGDYTVAAKVGNLTFTSTPAAKLGVVDNTHKVVVVADGSSAVVKVDTKGTGHRFKWKRTIGGNTETLVEGTKFKGVEKSSMTISKPLAGVDTAEYFCEVTGPGPAGDMTVVGGTTQLYIFTDKPVITTFDPPDGIVSGPYQYQVIMNIGADADLGKQAATLFSATGLPPGLKIDGKTGIISGIPTKPGSYLVKLTAGNLQGKVTAEASVEIKLFPADLAGTYAGLVERNDVLNSNMGGRIDLVVTPTGTFTGSLTLGTVKHPLKGQLDVDVRDPDVYLPRSTVVVTRTGGLPPLVVFFEIQNNGLVGNSQVNDGTNIAGISGWRQVWTTVAKPGVPANPATRYETYYTLGIKLAGGPDTLPQGWGYGSFKVAKDGKLSVAGKTADGEGITCGAFVGPNGEVLIFQPLYTTTPKGSLLGQIVIGLGANAEAAIDNTVGGALDWVRPPDTRTIARTYELGFGHTGLPVEVDVFGSSYGPIAGETMVMGVTAGTQNVELVFENGGVDLTSGPSPDIVFDLGAKNKITFPKRVLPNPDPNPAKVTMTLAAATGIFSGSFTLIDNPNPRPPPASLSRLVKFYGIIINDGTENHGIGFFMLPQLGEAAPSTVTNLNSDILSGSVDFRATAP
ncbi:MAG TPA: putative Ig domain-containing protein [Prosthecobacter sp.]|nr:putative Ig domain-containing protein [Prosthecobacter sp.]